LYGKDVLRRGADAVSFEYGSRTILLFVMVTMVSRKFCVFAGSTISYRII
jgi:hypothetical protein